MVISDEKSVTWHCIIQIDTKMFLIDLNCGKRGIFGNHIYYPKKSLYSAIKLNYRLFIFCTIQNKKRIFEVPTLSIGRVAPQTPKSPFVYMRLQDKSKLELMPSVLTKKMYFVKKPFSLSLYADF